MKTVFILGNDHTNSLGVAQCLGKSNYEVTAYVWGTISGILRHSKYVKEIHSAKDAQGCIDKMIEHSIKNRHKIPVIPCSDTAALVLEANKGRIANVFLFGYAHNYSLKELAVKEMQVNLALEAGFNVPKTWQIPNLCNLPRDLVYPCIIKPLISCQGAKSDIKICNSEYDLRKELNNLRYTKHVILQQYIERDYEISILGCGLKNGEAQIPCVENKLTLFPKNVGLECLANMQPLSDKKIISPIKTLINKIGYVGLFSVEMMHCKLDNKFYFTEINLRNDGANSFVYKYGYNLPLIHIADMLDEEPPSFNNTHPGYYIWEMHHLSSLLHRDINFGQWIRELRLSKGFLTYFKDDKIPFFWQFISPVLRKLHLTKSGAYI